MSGLMAEIRNVELYKKNTEAEVLPVADFFKEIGEIAFFLWAVQQKRCI